MPKDLSYQLQKFEILSSAPCRVDVGGTWDLKCFALPFAHINPVTTNIALSMRTRIRVGTYRKGRVRIQDDQHLEEFSGENINLNGHFGFLFAIVAHFNLSGYEVKIQYECPPRSGVGGSGTLAVALAGALARAQEFVGGGNLSRQEIVELVFNIEDGLRYSFTGLQDQCAAAFGGVNRWHWTYGELHSKFRREEILSPDNYEGLNKRLLVAYVGKSHDSNDVNTQQVTNFLAGKNREKWIRINEIATQYASALQSSDWETAGNLLNEEEEIRCSIVPSRITLVGEKLQSACKNLNAGFATAGSGNGGCVWALVRKPNQIAELSAHWESILETVHTAHLVPATIDPQGLKVEQFALEETSTREIGEN